MNILGIIPARYGSTRFPGKPLVMIGGRSMIRRVCEQAGKSGSISLLTVATDDARIEEHVRSFGGNVMMTSEAHRSGTERCAEVVKRLASEQGKTFDVVLNIQGDEPFIDPRQISELADCFISSGMGIATLAKRITSPDEVKDPNVVKVIADLNSEAIYFSRSPIPFIRGAEERDWMEKHAFFRHVGIYGYRTGILEKLVSLPETPLEKAESLEQLRWLEHGFSIYVRETAYESLSIDTPEDLLKFTNKKE
jgi:3-deoxy-manno-octulosonate cytidylyltransferase (CMP-KDO synthetase)